MTEASAPPNIRPEFTLLAIDPGLTGALAVYHPNAPAHIHIYDMPVIEHSVDAHRLRAIVQNYSPHLAVIEKVSPMPRDGVRQAWRFSAAYTTAHVVCALERIPLMLATPSVWKKFCGLKGGPEGKDQARARAIQAFPSYASQFERKKDAGRAEAALLALYAYNVINTAKDEYNAYLRAPQPFEPEPVRG